MKRTISLLLCLILALSSLPVIGVSAAGNDDVDADEVYLLGDVDLDGAVSVLDATAIQRDLASIAELSPLQKELADVTGEGLDVVHDQFA